MMPSQPSSASVHGCSNMLLRLSASCHFLNLKSGYLAITTVMSCHHYCCLCFRPNMLSEEEEAAEDIGYRHRTTGSWGLPSFPQLTGAAQVTTSTPLPKRNSIDNHIHGIAEKTSIHLCLYRHLCQVGFCWIPRTIGRLSNDIG